MMIDYDTILACFSPMMLSIMRLFHAYKKNSAIALGCRFHCAGHRITRSRLLPHEVMRQAAVGLHADISGQLLTRRY